MTAGNKASESGPGGRGNDYLWDGLGQPDPEIQRLEVLLRRYQHTGSAPVFPEVAPSPWWVIWPRRALLPRLGIVAAAAVVLIAALMLVRRPIAKPAVWTEWSVTRIAGTPRVGATAMGTNDGRSRLSEGQTLETDERSQAHLSALETGEIAVDPGTRLHLERTRPGFRQLVLDRGTIHAWIWAAPGKFVVDTPSARAVDLGCAYTLHVDDSGAGLLRTSRGWVGFQSNGHESFIPAGAACATRPGVGPGTPYFEDASEALRRALARFDFADNPEKRAQDLSIVLTESRKADALTLWHLLARVDQSQRAQVFDRLALLAPPPAGVTRDRIVHLDRAMLDRWWNELGFDDIAVWRHWEREWSERK
jgi:hypothetical protein